MTVIVHPPTSQKQKDELSKKVAEVYGLAIKLKMERQQVLPWQLHRDDGGSLLIEEFVQR